MLKFWTFVNIRQNSSKYGLKQTVHKTPTALKKKKEQKSITVKVHRKCISNISTNTSIRSIQYMTKYWTD